MMIYMNFRTDSVSTPRPYPLRPARRPLPTLSMAKTAMQREKYALTQKITLTRFSYGAVVKISERSDPVLHQLTSPHHDSESILTRPCVSRRDSLSRSEQPNFVSHKHQNRTGVMKSVTVSISQQHQHSWRPRERPFFRGRFARKLAKSSAPKVLSLAPTQARPPTLARNKEEIGLWQAGAFGTV